MKNNEVKAVSPLPSSDKPWTEISWWTKEIEGCQELSPEAAAATVGGIALNGGNVEGRQYILEGLCSLETDLRRCTPIPGGFVCQAISIDQCPLVESYGLQRDDPQLIE